MPEMRKVFSSHIDSISYDEDAGELHVVFSNGSHVVYAEVPPETGRGVLSAPSIGSELHRAVRGRFEHSYRQRGAGRRK